VGPWGALKIARTALVVNHRTVEHLARRGPAGGEGLLWLSGRGGERLGLAGSRLNQVVPFSWPVPASSGAAVGQGLIEGRRQFGPGRRLGEGER